MTESVPPEGQRLIDLVNRGEFASALGVSANTPTLEINKCQTRLNVKFQEYPEVIEAISKARVGLREQKKIPQQTAQSTAQQQATKLSSKLFGLPARISITLPVLILAFVGTVYALWRLQNIILIVIVLALFVVFRLAVRRVTNPVSTLYVLTVLFILTSGFATSVYFVLDQVIPDRQIVFKVIASLVLGFILGIFPGAFFFDALMEKANKPNFAKTFGIYCILFMVTFGLFSVFYLDSQIPESTAEPATAQAQNPVTPFVSRVAGWSKIDVNPAKSDESENPAPSAQENEPVGVWNVFHFLMTTFVIPPALFLIFIRSVLGSNWSRKLNNFSEVNFGFTMFCGMLSGLICVELIFYIPHIGGYVGGFSGVIRDTQEPLSTHFSRLLIYYTLVCVVGFAIYVGVVRLLYALFKGQRLSIINKVLLIIMSYYIGTALIIWLFPVAGMSLPVQQ